MTVRVVVYSIWGAFWLYWLIVLGVLALYFIYSATVEERLLAATFPSDYPGYRARTKMLIQFIL